MTLTPQARAALSARAKAAPRDAKGHFIEQDIGRKITVYVRSVPVDEKKREKELRQFKTPKSKRYSFRMKGKRPSNRRIETLLDRLEPDRTHFFAGGKFAKPWYERRKQRVRK